MFRLAVYLAVSSSLLYFRPFEHYVVSPVLSQYLPTSTPHFTSYLVSDLLFVHWHSLPCNAVLSLAHLYFICILTSGDYSAEPL